MSEASSKALSTPRFTPAVSHRVGDTEWIRPFSPQTRHQRLKDTEREYRTESKLAQRAASPSCRNCQNWAREDRLSDSKGTFGN